MVRVHREFRERFAYKAVFRCRDCGRIERMPHGFTLLVGDRTRCPSCGTERVTRLPGPDAIDRMHRNRYSLLRWIVKTRLYHCRYCRIQFYDRVRQGEGSAAASA